MQFITRNQTLIEQLRQIVGNDDPMLDPIYTIMALIMIFLLLVLLEKVIIAVLGHGR